MFNLLTLFLTLISGLFVMFSFGPFNELYWFLLVPILTVLWFAKKKAENKMFLSINLFLVVVFSAILFVNTFIFGKLQLIPFL